VSLTAKTGTKQAKNRQNIEVKSKNLKIFRTIFAGQTKNLKK
jgi:hypothetical protein